MIEKQRMDQAEQIDGQVMDLEDMQFKAEDLKSFTNRNSKKWALPLDGRYTDTGNQLLQWNTLKQLFKHRKSEMNSNTVQRSTCFKLKKCE